MTHFLLHTPVAGFIAAMYFGIFLGALLARNLPSLKDRCMVSGLLALIAPIWLEAARLALKGSL
jgi:hypothetical protein